MKSDHIKNWPKDERPRERLLKEGAHALTEAVLDVKNSGQKTEGLSIRYQFNFLSPKDYNQFFQKLRSNDLDGFRSQLDVALSKH